MANQLPFQIKRGTIDRVLLYTPASGEPVYATDINKLYVGDGYTPGGIPIGGTGGGGNLDFGTFVEPSGFTLDLGVIV
jgi:hypothetical protein